MQIKRSDDMARIVLHITSLKEKKILRIFSHGSKIKVLEPSGRISSKFGWGNKKYESHETAFIILKEWFGEQFARIWCHTIFINFILSCPKKGMTIWRQDIVDFVNRMNMRNTQSEVIQTKLPI